MSIKIILAESRGFCRGVKRAIKILDETASKYGPPVYVCHAIVHNDFVVNHFKDKGVIFVENIEEVPPKSILVLSAHGTAPKTILKAKKAGRKIKIIDAVCPLVKKIHTVARKYHSEGYHVLYIGHKNTREAIETMKVAPMQLIEAKNDVKKIKIKDSEKIACLTQTTLLLDEIKEIIKILKDKFPNIILPAKGNICYATQNRQEAVKKIAPRVDLVLVLGSKSSSNANRLTETARSAGTQSYLIDSCKDIQNKWLKNIRVIGLTAGASTPEILVEQTINYLKQKYQPPFSDVARPKNMFEKL